MLNNNSDGHVQKPMRNLLMLSTSFLFIFSAYGALEAAQSSINAELGVISLCAVYASYTVFSLLLPPLVISQLGSRKSIAVSVIGYAAYIAAHFYPRGWTLVTTGILVGASASVLWVAQKVYVTNLAFNNCGKINKQTENTVGYFHSIFMAIFCARGIGSIIMSILLNREAKVVQNEDTPFSSNASSRPSTTVKILNFNTTENFHEICGDPASRQWESSDPTAETKLDVNIDSTKLYIMLSVYIGFVIIGFVLLLCIDEMQEFKLPSDHAEQIAIDNEANKKSNRSKILSTGRLMTSNIQMIFLIPSSIQIGMYAAVPLTFYMRFWVTCSLGVDYVGYVAFTYSLMSSIMSLIAGRLLKYFHRKTLFFISCILEISCSLVVLLWTPVKEDGNIAMFFVFGGWFALGYTLQKCIITTAFSLFFIEDQDAGQSAFAFCEALGSASVFGLAPFITFKIQFFITTTILLLGFLGYFMAERIHSRISKINGNKVELLFSPNINVQN
uniref:protein unc-93 homolog A-like n=1 Tax=Styela clava TaxID=7725 RepID=UPI00193A3AE8|nr:protein unc-93 homolog A-like [Styela clava]